MQVGIDSFAASFDDPSLSIDASERLQNLIEEIKLADQIGLDVFGIGEHHRREFLDSAPVVILAAAASRTKPKSTTAKTSTALLEHLSKTFRCTARGLLSIFRFKSFYSCSLVTG